MPPRPPGTTPMTILHTTTCALETRLPTANVRIRMVHGRVCTSVIERFLGITSRFWGVSTLLHPKFRLKAPRKPPHGEAPTRLRLPP